MQKQYFNFTGAAVVAAIILLFASCTQQKEDFQKAEPSDADLSVATERKYQLDTLSVLTPVAKSLEDKSFELYEQLSKQLPKMQVGDDSYYIVEGDMLMDNDDLMFYCQKRLVGDSLVGNYVKDSAMKRMDSRTLTVATTRDGKAAIWPAGYVIRYAILKKSFRDAQHYNDMISMMRTATQDWMNAANVRFEYVPAYDNLPADAMAPNGLTFVVREYNAGGSFIAMSFFPPDPVYKRKMWIDPSFYGGLADMTGVLRHELGHVLGMRHEHIWNSGCTSEQIVESYLGARQVTPYDPYSVMHYMCKGLGTFSMTLTNFDKEGIAKVYGPRL